MKNEKEKEEKKWREKIERAREILRKYSTEREAERKRKIERNR